jgi:alpha-ribazole phosphatase
MRLCGMKELDFGDFCGKTADELSSDPRYAEWLESHCQAGPPGGESVCFFKEATCADFEKELAVLKESGAKRAAMVLHAGNIMAILERHGTPKRDFFSWRLPNCGFFMCGCAKSGLEELARHTPAP